MWDISDLLSVSDFSELVYNMEKNIQEALDIQAPLKKKQLPIRTREFCGTKMS